MATPHEPATRAAAAEFRAGGSAVDAALAAAATLTVTYPHQCSLGGDLIAMLATPDGEFRVINGSGRAASATSLAGVRARTATMPALGPDTVTVPGTIAAWGTLHELGGRRPFHTALREAINYAEHGSPISPSLRNALLAGREVIAADAGLTQVFGPLPTAEAPAAPRFRQPALAESLRRLARDGPHTFYDGALGGDYVTGLRALGSALRPVDLGTHATEVVQPLSGTLGEIEVLTAPPNSQGDVLLRALPELAELKLPLDPMGTAAGLIADVIHRSSALRDETLADAGSPPSPSGDTVAVVAVDARGHAVSLIQSLFSAFGSGLLEPRTGIIAQNRGAGFVLDPRSPNALGPGRRPAHTLMPVMLRRRGRLARVHGAAGGYGQPQIHLQLLLHALAGATAETSVAAPRWITSDREPDRPPRLVLVERDVPSAARAALCGAGFVVEEVGPRDERLGHAQSATVAGGRRVAATDPRADGSAAAGDG